MNEFSEGNVGTNQERVEGLSTVNLESPNEVNKTNKKGSKIIIGVIITLFLMVLLIIGFISYKFYIGVDPVKEVTTRIRTLGKDITSAYQDNYQMKLIQKYDKLHLGADMSATMNMAGEDISAGLSYDMKYLKKDSKVEANLKAIFNNEELIDAWSIISQEALFFKVLEDGYTFKSNMDSATIDLEEQIKNMANNKSVENYLNYLADAIEHNISKKDFKRSVIRTSENNSAERKEILAQYSLTLTKQLVQNVIEEFLEKLKNDETIKNLIDKEDLNVDLSDFTEMNLDIYVGIRGVTSVKLTSTDPTKEGIIQYIKLDDEHKLLKLGDKNNDFLVINIMETKQSTTIDLKIDDDEIKVNGSATIKADGNFQIDVKAFETTIALSGQIKENQESQKATSELIANLNVKNEDLGNMKFAIKVKSSIEANDNLTIDMPSEGIDIDTSEGQNLLLNDFSQTKIFQYLFPNEINYSDSSTDDVLDDSLDYSLDDDSLVY